MSFPTGTFSLSKRQKLICLCIVLASIIISFTSCSVVKRVKEGEHLIIENTILEDDKKTTDEQINNIVIQKTNTGVNGFFSFPLRLHIYNLARPNIDSIIEAKVLSDSSKVKWK